jgi:leucyl/phenylalanyl-tRNA--protein transferase
MVFSLTKELIFPPVHLSDDDGLLAVGGDLSTERLLLAYRSGIFPWYNEPPILWWSPDPRFVLFPAEILQQ